LIHQKLSGQARLVRELLCNHAASVGVASAQSLLASATTIQEIRQIESLAAKLYWTAWRDIPINFPSADLKRVPQHWRRFGTRTSVLTGSPRLAVNPPNAMLNYLYAVVESEACLAAGRFGLDSGIGVLHVDTDARDSFACDLMEPVRPRVDEF